MHRHDLDLIAAMAEGSLEDESLARARVETCHVCRAELEAQTLALGALADEESIGLTDHERAVLRRDVWTELQADQGPRPAPVPWYHRWSYAAVGLILLVGLVGLLGRTLDEAAEPIPATVEEAAEPAADEPVAEPEEEVAEALDVPENDFFARQAERVRQEAEDMTRSFQLDAASETALARCVDRAGLTGYQALGEVADDDVVYIVAVPSPDDIGPETPVAFVDASSCRLVTVDE